MPQRRSIHPDTVIQALVLLVVVLLFLWTMGLAASGRIGFTIDPTPWDFVLQAFAGCFVGLLLYQLGSLLVHALKWHSKRHRWVLRLIAGYLLLNAISLPVFFHVQAQFAGLHFLFVLVFMVVSPFLSYSFHKTKPFSADAELLDAPSVFQ